MLRVYGTSAWRAVRFLMTVMVMGAIVVCGVAGVPVISDGGAGAVRAESAATDSRMAAGYCHSLLVRPDGTLWAWGRNDSGELGLGDNVSRSIPAKVGTAANWVSVAASWYHSLGIRSDGTLWGWGENDNGQLGLGYQSWRTTIPVKVGTATNWAAVSTGHFHTLGLRSDGTLWVWGSNGFGQLGLPEIGVTENVTSPTQLGTDSDWVAIAAGDGHSLAVKSDGSLWSWGANSRGQLGLGHTSTKYTPTPVPGGIEWATVEAEYDYSLGIDRDGTLWSWGLNVDGQLGLGNTATTKSPALVGSGWAGVYPGRNHCLGLRTDGTLYAWGANWYGQLGQGSYYDQEESPQQVGSESNWLGGAGGDQFSIGFRSDGTAWGWGRNGSGQLGWKLNDFNEQPSPKPALLDLPLTVSTSAASGILENGATINGSLVSLGSAASAQVSFEWGPTASYGSMTLAQTKTATGAFSAGLAGLAAGTTYYYRARAVAGEETVYGEAKTLATANPAIPPVAPTVTSGAAAGVTTSTAALRGSLTALGTSGSVTVSFEYGPEAAPYSRRTSVQVLGAAGDFTADLTGLAAGTTYYFRARADGDGTAYGAGLTFTTEAIPGVSPVVETLDAGSITATSARLNGHLASLGAAASVEVLFQWGTVSGSYPSESAAVRQSGTGAFFFDVTGLAPGTAYYYRTRAVGEGSSCGEEKSFTTEAAPGTPDAGGDTDSGTTSGRAPQVQGVEAASGKRGESLTVTISGANLEGATSVSFGAGITVEGFTVDSSSRITADIVIAGDAQTGAREVSVTTGAGTVAKSDAFNVAGSSGGGFCSRGSEGTASAASEVTISMTALGLVLGTGYWITRKRAK